MNNQLVTLNNTDIQFEKGVITFSNFEQIKNEVKQKSEVFKNLVVTEDAIQNAKNDRAELNKLSKALNDRRKEIKKSYNDPLQDFESKIKEIDSIIQEAVTNIDSQIRNHEDNLKNAKKEELFNFFNEHAKVNNLDFISFEDMGLNITLSASMKSLKEQVTTNINQIVSDIQTINTQENKERILVEYQRTLDLTGSILSVSEAIKREEEIKTKQDEVANQEKTIEPIEVKETLHAPIEVEEELRLQFTVYGTRTQLKALKQYIESEGLRYE